MVGKKRWTVFELCLVRAMLKANYSFQDVVDHFAEFFPEARHPVGLTSIKHVEKEYLRAEPYASIEAHWEDIPGKKGYLLGLYALGTDFTTIASQIDRKYPSHTALPFWRYTVRTVIPLVRKGRTESSQSSKGADSDKAVRTVGTVGTVRTARS